MRLLKQSTSVDVPIGPFLDETDGKTAETALTITQPDIRLKKNGGAWAQKAAAQTLTHEENGNYEVTLDATDTDTLGLLRVHVHESGALPVWEDFMVMPANVWDSFFGADALQVHAVEISNALITAASIASAALTKAKFANDTGLIPTLTGTAGAGSATTITLTGGVATNDYYNGSLVYLVAGTGAGQARFITDYVGATTVATVDTWVTNPDNTSVFAVVPSFAVTTTAIRQEIDSNSTQLAAIVADTNELQTDWANGGRLDLLIDSIISELGNGTYGLSALETLVDGLEASLADATFGLSALETLVDELESRLTAVRAGYLDNLSAGAVALQSSVDDLEGRLTAALATQLTAHSLAVLRGVVDASSTTTAVIFKTINGAAASGTNDFYNGRHIVFTSGALLGQATSISDYDGATKTATVPALTGAPAEDVTFVVV